MTQIVYDGNFLIADRKCYRGYVTTKSTKIQHLKIGELDRYYVFSGSFMECALGEKVVESCFDPEVVAKVRSILSKEVLEDFYGLMIDVHPTEKRNVFLLNYAGDAVQIDDAFVTVGAMHGEITVAYKLWEKMNFPRIEDYEGTIPLAGFLRFVLKGSMFDQEGVEFDCYNINTGYKLCV